MKNLSYVFYLVLAVVITSCQPKDLDYKIIRSKYDVTYMNDPMPKGLCRFFYVVDERGSIVEFRDNCDKYNVGDTIVGVKRNYR